MISIEEFQKLDLRVAQIIRVDDIEGSDKLYKLLVDVGEQTKQIVAGIKQSYSKDQLVGKQVVIVNNLKPTKLMGVESNGMLLAASDGNPVILTTEKNVKNGSKIK